LKEKELSEEEIVRRKALSELRGKEEETWKKLFVEMTVRPW